MIRAVASAIALFLIAACASRTAEVTGPPAFPIFQADYDARVTVQGAYPLYRFASDTTKVDWFMTRQTAKAQLTNELVGQIRAAIRAAESTYLRSVGEEANLTATRVEAALETSEEIDLEVHGLSRLEEQWNDEWYGAVYGMDAELFVQQLEQWTDLTLARVRTQIAELDLPSSTEKELEERVEDDATRMNFHEQITNFLESQGLIQRDGG